MKNKLLFIRNFAMLLFTLLFANHAYSQNALDFDGVDDYITTSFPGVLGSADRTFEAWIYLDAAPSSNIAILDYGTSASGSRNTFIINPNLQLSFLSGGTNGNLPSSNNVVPVGQWVHVAFVLDNGTGYSYVNGVQVATGNLSGVNTPTGGNDLRIGQRVSGGSIPFEGKIDEVRVWDIARSLTQINLDTATEFCTPQTGLVAYHRFNSGTAGGTNTTVTTSTDDSGLNNDGTLQGFALTGSTSNWVSGKLSPCVPPSCQSPSGLGADNVLGTTADVYFTQGNTGSTVKLQYGTTGFTLGSGTNIIPTNDTISLTGLSPQTTYDVYILEVCSPTDSSGWSTFSFTTGCGLITTYPYYESFEGTNWVSGSGTANSGFSIDPCWSATSNSYQWGTRSGSTSSSTTGPSSAYGGSNFVFTEASQGSTGDKADFTSPNYDLSSLTVPQLSFGYHMYGSDMGTFQVWAWNGTAYDTIMSLSGDQGNAWVEAIIDLSPYKNDTTHLVFHGVRGSGFRSDMAIDSIVIGEAPPCPKPGVVTFDSITATSVNLVFSSPGHAFNVEFGPTGFTQGTGTTTTINGSGDTITGLTPNTSYDFYLSNNCTDSSNGFSAWVGPFTVVTECSYTNNYFTDWDYLSNTQTDNCWSFLAYGSTTAYARAYDPGTTVALQPFSGNIYYRYYNSGATASFLVSPEITDLATNTLQLRFQAGDSYTGSTGTPEFYIGTMLSANDTTSFTPIDTVTTLTDVWTEFTVLLTGVPANHKYVVIRHANNANNVYMAIDDLYIEVQPACVAPSLGMFSDIRDTSVVLNWTAGDGNTFEIEYGMTGFLNGFGLGTTISGLTSTVDTLTGLMPDTCYDVYIRGNCTSNNSPWYGPITFCTECATQVAPFVEDFEGAQWLTNYSTPNEIDDCWTRTPESTSSYRWQPNTGNTSSFSTGPATGAGGAGKYIYTEASRGTNNALAYLEMPKADFSGLTTPAVHFSYHMYGSNMGELHVLINDGTQTDTIWSISGAQQAADTSDWITAYVDISAYMSQPATISFLGKRGGGINSDIALDDVGIDELPNCLTPTGLTLDSVFTTFADFSWTSPSNGTSFKMEYGPTGFRQASATGTNVYAGSSPTRVSGLMPGMTYDIYLSDMCDSTDWVGPITFTTIIQNDAELESIISPFDLACGDSSFVVEIKVKNNGQNAITTLPVGANITGAITSNITNTYTGNIAPGASTTILLGTINTYMGGVINIDAYTGLSGDQDMTNDTLSETGLELISAVPLHMPVDSVCVNDTAGIFVAIPQTGISHNWYANAQDVTPIATGDTVGVQPGQTLYLDRSLSNSLVVQTGTAGSLYGTMFKVYVKQDFIFSGYTWISHLTGAKSLKAFYKMGDYKGHETTRSSWTLIDSLEQATSSSLASYRFDFRNPVTFNMGDTVSIYIASKTGKYEAQGLAGATIDSVFKTTKDFEYIAGVGGAYFGNNMTTATSASSIALTLHWESLDVCGNKRIALTMGVNNDTAVASFTSVINANGADVDFDASASSGHVYDWDFGDGQSGTGVNPTNTYAAAGTYTVTLVVTDTVCGTTDTITQTVMPTVSLKELEFAGSIEVYPNPNNGKFNVDLDLIGGQDVQLALANTVGQVVYTKDLGRVGGHVETELTIENLAPGVYYLRVMANGKSTTVKITVL